MHATNTKATNKAQPFSVGDYHRVKLNSTSFGYILGGIVSLVWNIDPTQNAQNTFVIAWIKMPLRPVLQIVSQILKLLWKAVIT